MLGSPTNDLRAWLHSLKQTPEGQIRVVNLYRLCGQIRNTGPAPGSPLCSPTILRRLFGACLARADSTPSETPIEVLRNVAAELSHGDFGWWDAHSLDSEPFVVNVISAGGFWRHLVNEDRQWGLPEEPEWTHKSEIGYRRDLHRLTSTSTSGIWWRPGSEMGRPIGNPHVVWLTDRAAIRSAVGRSLGTQRATRTRDALGLLHYGRGTYLLQMRIPVACLVGIRNFEAGRPAIAGLPNDRFAAYLSDADSNRAYLRDLGMTVHLEKLARRHRSQVSGVPERVSIPLSMDKIGPHVKVRALGRVMLDRGVSTGVDDHPSFEKLLSRKESIDEMIEALVAAVA
jgi:hypothetical protein